MSEPTKGAPVSRGRWMCVGEKAPELFVPYAQIPKPRPSVWARLWKWLGL